MVFEQNSRQFFFHVEQIVEGNKTGHTREPAAKVQP